MGLSLRKIGNSIRDVFDANTASDQAKRVAQGRPAQYSGVNLASPASVVKSVAQRALPNTSFNNPGSVAFGVANKFTPMGLRDRFDSNTASDQLRRAQATQTPFRVPTSYEDQQAMQGNERPLTNFGQQVAGNLARVVNTAYQNNFRTTPQAIAGLVLKGANRTGLMNDRDYSNAVNNMLTDKNVYSGYTPKGGVLNAGTVIDSPEQAKNLNGRDVVNKSVGYGLGVYGELSPIGAKGGLVGRTLLGATEGAVGDVGSQMVNTGNVNLRQTAGSAVFGGTLSNVGPAISKLVNKGSVPTPKVSAKGKVDIYALKDTNKVLYQKLESNRLKGLSDNNPSQIRLRQTIQKNEADINRISQGGYLNFGGSDKMTPEAHKTEVINRLHEEANQFDLNNKDWRSNANPSARAQFADNARMFKEFRKNPEAFVVKYGLVDAPIAPAPKPKVTVKEPVITQLANDAPQGKPQTKLYRGGSEPIDPSKMTERGISLSTDKDTAKWFAGYDNKKVESVYVSPDAKILSWEEVPQPLRDALDKPLSKSPDIKSSIPDEMAVVNYARSKGYDGVAFGGKYSEGEVRIINPSVISKNTTPQVGKTPMYRGASKAEWESVQKNGKFGQNEKSIGDPVGKFNDDVHTVGSKQYAENYAFTGGADGVVIEYKPTANKKMRGTSLVDTTDMGKVQEARGKGLDINDVQRVTDRNGNVIYEASGLTYKPGSKVVNGGRVSVNTKQVRDANAKTLNIEEGGDLYEVRIKENNRGDVEFLRYDSNGNFMDATTKAKLEKSFGRLSDDELAGKSVYGNGKVVTEQTQPVNANFERDLSTGKMKFQSAPQVGKTPVLGEVSPKPKVTAKRISDEQLLDIKIAKVKDPVRKAELVAERNAKQPIIAKPVDVRALETANPLTKAPKEPNAFNRAWMSVNGTISKYGEAGQDIARRNKLQRELSETGQQAFLDSIPSVGKLNREEFPQFVQALDDLSKGNDVSVAPNIQKAISEWNTAIPTVRDRAVGAGLEVGDLGPNYFPRQYPDLFKGDKGMGRMAEAMVAGGKATDIADAMAKLRFMKNEYQKPFGNLEKTREFDMPGYDNTQDAVNNYVSRAFDRITKAEQFGAKNEIINQAQAKMLADGYNAGPGSTVDRYMRIALGDVDKSTPGYKVSGAVRQFNSVTSLGTGAVSNSTQLTNTATVAGIGRTIHGIYKYATDPAARARATSSGVLLDHTINKLAEQGLGTKGKITKNIAAPFFNQVEKFNREVTAIVGADYGNNLLKHGNIDALRNKFRVTGELGDKLTKNQEIEMARRLVEISQFKVDPMDLPGWVDSPLGKAAAQFRTFGYKQTDFMWNQVLREFMKGNGAPLARFVAVGVPLGAASQYVKSKIKGTTYTEDDESKTSQATKALMAVGGGGLVSSEAQNLYKSAQYDNLTGGIAGVVGGPTASLVAGAADNINKAVKGNAKPLGKQVVSKIPVAGQFIANKIFPKAPKDRNTTNLATADLTPEELDKKSTARIAELKKNMVANDYGLEQLPNGRYAATIDGEVKTFAKQSEARLASRKDKFEKSDKNFKIIGDTVLRKDSEGKVVATTKAKYDNSLNKAQLTKYKDAEDFGAWTTTAQKQLDNIGKQLEDPNIDELDRIALENQAQSLMDDYEKYASYGGAFKKGKGGGSGGSSASNPLKYAVSTKSTAKGPTISLRTGGAGRRVTLKAPTGAPKVSTKKSLV